MTEESDRIAVELVEDLRRKFRMVCALMGGVAGLMLMSVALSVHTLAIAADTHRHYERQESLLSAILQSLIARNSPPALPVDKLRGGGE